MPFMSVIDDTIPKESLPVVSPAIVLGWIAASAAVAWYPLLHARATGILRDAMDEPLFALRTAGLIRVADWQQGVGQGFVATTEGHELVGHPDKLALLLNSNAKTTVPLEAPITTTFERGERIREAVLSPSPPIVAPAIIVLNVLWFAVGLLVAKQTGVSLWNYLSFGDISVTARLGGLTGTDLLRDEWWRLIVSCFVHQGAFHLLLNMYALGALGPLIESKWGRSRFLLLYAASGVGGACLAMVFRPEAMVSGASGAVWGLLTSAMVWLVLYREHLPEGMVPDGLRRLGIMLGLNAAISFVPGISWEAHFGGGIVGALVACIFGLLRPTGGGRRTIAALGSMSLLAVCVVALGFFAYKSEKWRPLRDYEYRKQRYAYLKQVNPILATIDLQKVSVISSDARLALAVQTPARWKGTVERVRQLNADAKAAAIALRNMSRPRFFATDVRASMAAYADTVADWSEALLAMFNDPSQDMKLVDEKRKLIDKAYEDVSMK